MYHIQFTSSSVLIMLQRDAEIQPEDWADWGIIPCKIRAGERRWFWF